MLAAGVGNIRTASDSGGVATSPRSCRARQLASFSSETLPDLGVGQFAASYTFGVLPFANAADLGFGLVVGVPSQTPPPLSQMGSADVGGTEHAPLRIEPEFGQRPENNIKPPASDCWDVLHEDESRSHLANDPVHLPPETAALSCEARAFSRDRDVLAREAPGEDIDSPSPCGPVELGNVIVDLHLGRQPTFVASCLQNGAAVRVDLNRANGAVTQQQAAEDAASGASEQVQLAHQRTTLP
jgi:hypothetical protein